MAAIMDLIIEEGATYSHDLLLKDAAGAAIDLTGYTARMYIKAAAGDVATLLELTTANGRITITPLTGLVSLLISATDTAALTWSKGVYDLELVSGGGFVTRLLQGAVNVSANVTE